MKFHIIFCLLAALMMTSAFAEVTVEPLRHSNKNPTESECKKACADAYAKGDQSKIPEAHNFRDYYCNCHVIVQ
uniref:Mu-scoloptoxin(15)-Ssd1a n=1 Tax=Scolopendra dehaani TaxID=2609776 RepID=TXF1A_SCODE|nr:RecName: Full=Mu-scoloptoxin(15)-Ssd1a; Short=Mu-SLPTX(15)-Ssd1a; AltName: Full=Toxin SSD800; Flags: Precursor [Scolopendra dehaani]